MTDITDVFYGLNTTNLLLRKPWLPSSMLYPVDTTEGFLFIAEDDGTITEDGKDFVTGDVIIYKDGGWAKISGSGGGAGVGGWELVTGFTTLELNSKYILDFGVGPSVFNVQLPDNPQEGDEIVLAHIQGDLESLSPTFNKITQAGSGEWIASADEDMDLDSNYEIITLVFSDIAGIGWRVY